MDLPNKDFIQSLMLLDGIAAGVLTRELVEHLATGNRLRADIDELHSEIDKLQVEIDKVQVEFDDATKH